MKGWLALGVFCFVMAFVSVFALSFVNMLLAFAGFFGFAIAGVLILLITGSKVNTGNAHLRNMSGTRRGRATILSAEPTSLYLRTGEVEHPPQTYRLQLRVELEGEGTYEVRHHQGVQPWLAGQFAPGRVVPCLVHPRKRSVVHLLLDEPGAGQGVISAWGGAPKSVGGPGLVGGPGGPAMSGLDDLMRQATGSGLEDLLRRVEAGEQVPGVIVSGDIGGALPGAQGVSMGPPSGAPGVPASGVGGAGSIGGVPSPSPAGSHREATAVVNSVRDLGPSPTGRQAVELDLLVALVGHAPYNVVLAAERDPARIPQQGEALRVLVDPARPDTLLILD